MAMSDLELLQLVDTVKDRQRGPQGEQGISVVEINQPDPDSFVITLSNGKTHRISLVPGRDGETGPQGIRGERGPEGPAGRNGQPGAVGAPGRDGRDGADGVSVETAIVNSNGHLLVGLSDGGIVDVGRVVGPAGSTGDVGPSGLPGKPGSDGAAVLSGPRAPQESDGAEGDHWIDISSAEFAFYKKSGNGWNKVANLRQPAPDMRVGAGAGGGSGGGGNGQLQNTRTLPLVNGGSTIRKKAQAKNLPLPGAMASQEDANLYFLECLNRDSVHVGVAAPAPPYTAGQLWFSTEETELTLFIYDGNDWVVASPPVSLDGIESNIYELQDNVRYIQKNMTPFEAHQELYGKHEELEADQQRQDQQLEVLQGEIDQLAPAFERGAWNYDDGDGVAQGTEYVLIGVQTQESFDEAKAPIDAELIECNKEANGNPQLMGDCNRVWDQKVQALPQVGEPIHSNRWELANKITFNYMDLDGTGHTFEDVEPGQLLDMVCEDGSGFMVAEITGIKLGMWYEEKILDIKPISFKGVAHGRTNVKIFKIDDTVGPEELTDFVRKSGDTITGTLKLKQKSTNSTVLDFNDETGQNFFGLRSEAAPQDGGPGDTARLNIAKGKQFKITSLQADKQVFKIYKNGNVFLGNLVDPGSDRAAATKKYVDDAVAEAIANIQFPNVEPPEPPGPARLCWEYRKPGSGKAPADGCFWFDNEHFRFSYKTHNGINLGKYKPEVRNEWGAPGAADDKGAFEMTIWKKYDDGWYMYDHLECSDTRWSIENEGVKHFQFKRAWRSHKQDYSTGAIYYFTVGGFF